MRESEGDLRQPAAMEGASTDQNVERASTTGATKRTTETQLTPNTVEGYIGGLRSFDGHQDVQTNVMPSNQTAKEDSAAE